MNSRSTMFDSYISIAATLLQQALNDGGEHDLPDKYINNFCEMVVTSMWRCVFNAITSFELYGDTGRFEFNLSGYIDTYYENDNIHWRGFSDEQVNRLKRAYPNIVQSFKDAGLDIIEHYLRALSDYDIERAVEYVTTPAGQKPRGTFRNLEYIAYECKDGRRSAEEIYNSFLKQAKRLIHYNK